MRHLSGALSGLLSTRLLPLLTFFPILSVIFTVARDRVSDSERLLCFGRVFSERELTFTFAICYRPSVCRLSVCLSSVTLMRPTQAVQIFGNISTAFGTLAIR